MNDGGVHTAALHGDCLRLVSVHDIKVEVFLIGVGRDLNNLRRIEWNKRTEKGHKGAMKKSFLSSSIYLVIVIGADFLGTESFIDEM